MPRIHRCDISERHPKIMSDVPTTGYLTIKAPLKAPLI